jgi:hypothetical protein
MDSPMMRFHQKERAQMAASTVPSGPTIPPSPAPTPAPAPATGNFVPCQTGYDLIRIRTRQGLVKKGESLGDAAELANAVTNADIEATATKVKASSVTKDKPEKVTTLGDGTFLTWLENDLPTILQIIETIIVAIGASGV